MGSIKSVKRAKTLSLRIIKGNFITSRGNLTRTSLGYLIAAATRRIPNRIKLISKIKYLCTVGIIRF